MSDEVEVPQLVLADVDADPWAVDAGAQPSSAGTDGGPGPGSGAASGSGSAAGPVALRLTTKAEALTEAADRAAETSAAEAAVHVVRAGDLDALAGAAIALSRWLLTPPTAETLDVVRDAAMLEEWPLPRRGATEAGLADLAASRVEEHRAVAADHARLFVGPGRVIAPPYESVHRSDEGLLFDEETLAVRAWYQRFGLSAPRVGREPDDHLGLELEFVATLLGASLEALDGDDEHDATLFAQAAGAFLDAHVRRWAPTFFGIVLTHAQTDFYRGVARLGLGLLEESAAILPPAT